jgi:hypothetical protein
MTDEAKTTTRFVYSYTKHDRHAQEFMLEQVALLGFRIVASVPQSLFDRWDFELDITTEQLTALRAAAAADHLTSKTHAVFCKDGCFL